MKNLADLQLTTVTDNASKSSITKQVNIYLNWFNWFDCFVHVSCTYNTNYFEMNSSIIG